jgi:hypothetical protein
MADARSMTLSRFLSENAPLTDRERALVTRAWQAAYGAFTEDVEPIGPPSLDVGPGKPQDSSPPAAYKNLELFS